ncbi:enoyl-CoA hydratase/isomerase family protein [Tessaracoccus terricola]
MSQPILLAVDDGLARITLNRPERLNAFDTSLAAAWEETTSEVTAREDVGAVLLDAAGPAFCAGGDVVAMAATMGSGAQIEALAETINRGIRTLRDSSLPVVAAAHGTTAGGGLGILLTSDYAVVGRSSRIGSLYANVGLTPDLSVTAQLARAVGERRALQLLLSDRMLTADEALGWGLVAEVVDDDAVGSRAEEVARSWLSGAARAYGEAKRLVRSQPGRSFEAQLSEEAATIGAIFGSAEAQARIAAFAKRGRS